MSKQLKKLLKQLGLDVVDLRQKQHLVLTLENSYGLQHKFTVAKSASDHRAFKNMSARLKRFAASADLNSLY